jgi:predicted phage terminase large subunit-like protein
LEAVTAGHIRKLLINIPPRCGKSTLVSIMWPCWELISRPSGKWLYASHAESLSIRDNRRGRQLIDSAWYQSHWGHVFQFCGDQNAKQRVETDKGGQRIALGIGGAATGEGGDRLVVDDPHNIENVESELVRTAVLDWYDTVWSTRANDPRTSSYVCIMQRSHQQDLSGHLLAQGGWQHLKIPMEYEPAEHVTGIGWRDPRREEGELLWPERFDAAWAAEKKTHPYVWAGQYQQRPSPAGGGLFRREWWQFYRELPLMERYVISMDPSFRKSVTSDPTCIQAWGLRGPDRYLVAQILRRMTFTEALAALRSVADGYPGNTMKLVEGKANGDSIVDTLKGGVPGLVVFEPHGTKEERAASISPLVEAGNVYLPLPDLHPWVRSFIQECSDFPNGYHDDQVDAMSQCLIKTSREPAQRITRDQLDACVTDKIEPLFNGNRQPWRPVDPWQGIDPVLRHHMLGKGLKRQKEQTK